MIPDDRLKELAFNFDMEGLAKPNDVILEIDSALNELLTAHQRCLACIQAWEGK